LPPLQDDTGSPRRLLDASSTATLSPHRQLLSLPAWSDGLWVSVLRRWGTKNAWRCSQGLYVVLPLLPLLILEFYHLFITGELILKLSLASWTVPLLLIEL
jgi:hypothetical protein